LLALAVFGALCLGLAACGGEDAGTTGGGAQAGDGELSGSIRVDGSSTVFPFAQAAGELFNEENPGVRISTGQSGTGGGFEKFCAGQTDISNASRAIEADEEQACQAKGIRFAEVQVANDGIAIATNADLAVDCLTTAQLKRIWDKGSQVDSLRDVDPRLPDTPLSLYGPGTDSGTFDFFTEQINGEEGRSRTDYEASEDDNQLVTGVSGDEGGLGYFGFSYAQGAEVKVLGVDDGAGCVKPSAQTIQDGTYKPLARPLYMYPSAQAVRRPEVKAFMDFVIRYQEQIAKAARIVPLTREQVADARQELAAGGS